MKRICVVTGSRAEFGQLEPLLKKLQEDDFFELNLVVTGAHLSSANTVEEIKMSGINIYESIQIENINNNTRVGIARQISEVITKFSNYLSQDRPDIIVLIGDRYEIFAVGVAASILMIPIAHICGGSSTSGAIDEIYRHSLSKMSSIHFTTCESYRNRVIQLGENPKTVYNVGSLAIENCLKRKLITKEKLKTQLNIPNNKKYCVVTFHPVTLEENSVEKEMQELIKALAEFKDYVYLITLSNADCGGSLINNIWLREAQKRNNFIVVSSLGMQRYLTVLKYSEMMIGNSSSGTTEGPTMHIPTIDIGDRQRGRYFAPSVIHCETKKEDIVRAINIGREIKFRNNIKKMKNPFGDGTTSDKILSILKSFCSKPINLKKDFYDIK